MKVAVVYQYYQGHAAPGHSLVYELCQHLGEQGHSVSVISGETGYMKRQMSELPWYKRIVRKEQDGVATVVRTFCYSELHRSYLGRLLSFLSFSLSCPLGLLTIKKPDVVLASSPPIFPVFTAWLLCRLRGIPFVLEVRDLWPASAVQLGIVKSRFLLGVMGWMERLLYRHSARIITLTEGIRQDIAGRGWPAEKLETITCGVDPGLIYPDPEGGVELRQRLGWGQQKIVLYFGALGEANNMPVILRAAERLQERCDIRFVLVGDGMKRAETEQVVAERGLNNVTILAPVPKDQARLYISAADICLVTLRDVPLFDGAIPTKLIDYMACGRPVLCGIRGEARRILADAGGGLAFEPEDDANLAAKIKELLGDPERLQTMGGAGAAYVQQHFSALTMRRRTEQLLQDVAGIRS